LTVRITAVETWVVNVPLTTRFTSSFQSRSFTTRNVVLLRTDEGLTGIGETMKGAVQAEIIKRVSHLVVGQDPFNRTAIFAKLHMLPFFHGYAGYNAIAALEMACWDLMGKALGVPVYRLLGGAVRKEMPITALITRGMMEKPDPERLAEAAAETVSQGKFRAVKFKGSTDPHDDLKYMTALRKALGPDARLRIDPNAHWTVPDSIHAGHRLEEIGLEYLEDPCAGLEGMAQVRRAVRIPLCTNMCCVRLEEVAPAVRMGAVDIIHGDVMKWGGIEANRKLAACCEAFGLGMNLHSGGELGIATASHLHLAAATPQITYAIDSMYYLLADDVIAGEMIPVRDGCLQVPEGPGLGIEVDEAKLRRYHERYREEGEAIL
jgi:glucarate dehydratase